MNFKNCIMLLCLCVHLYTANAKIRKNPQELARLYQRIPNEGKGVTKDSVKKFIKQTKVQSEFRISWFDEDKINGSMWDYPISQEEFVALVTSKFTYKQLEHIYNRIYKKNQYVNKQNVEDYLQNRRRHYGIKKYEINEIIAPLSGSAMKWDAFYRLMVFKKYENPTAPRSLWH
ncbi:uncharacterized protein LOC126842278 [Adelges cooleyi]|uniref:uncharacterized protein LOC126842278 n=1 Tax=Adelges cooleyi TaxID=133065 RepID=UPI00217FF545|nr:uncharacterized protein LOC126842278 [Adelges cooleyi]